MPKLPRIIVILGPTGSGKSSLAVKLAKQFSGAIISADSRQIYKGMDIGTAKITQKEMQGVPHYMLDIVRPDQEFTLADYQKKVFSIIDDLHKKKTLPFLVGGTGLYIQAIVDNLQIPEGKPNKKLRAQLEKLTNSQLIAKLKKFDPASLKSVDTKNRRRLIRALEVVAQTGQSFAKQRKKGQPKVEALQLGLNPPREKLVQNINARVDEMIDKGLVLEAKKLVMDYGPGPYALSGIGYKEIIQHLNGELTLEQAVERTKISTRQYAKRQMTWFSSHGGSETGGKRNKRIKWVKSPGKAEKLVTSFVKN